MKDVLTTPEARPASLGSTSLIAASNTGLKAIPAPSPSRIMAGSTSTTKLPSTGAREEQQAGRGETEAHGQWQPDSEPHDEPRRQADREDPHDDVPGQEREADLERRVSEHELQVQRGEEEPREHRAGPEHADDVRHRDVPKAEQPERNERRLDLDSMTRNAASSAPETARRPSVLAVTQPTSLPFTIA